MKDSTADFRERIHSALPVTHQAFYILLGLLDIRPSTEIPTASVSLGLRSVLRINPDFIKVNCPSDETLMMLVLHELMHVLLGHTRLYNRITDAQNIAFDAVINAHLCRSFPKPEYTALFRNLYAPDLLPEALLRPPAGWGSPEARWCLEGRAGEVHRALYLDDSVTTGELLELVEQILPAMSGKSEGERQDNPDGFEELTGRLLGDHHLFDGAREEEGLSPDLLRTLREIIARWPREVLQRGRDEGGRLEGKNITPKHARRLLVFRLRHALLAVASGGPPESTLRRQTLAARPSLRPWLSPSDRRGAVLSVLGRPPLLWGDTVIDRSREPVSKTALYIDVSGSMAAHLELIYGALAPLSELLEPVVRLFSTEIQVISLPALRRGLVRTSGGTGISCVTADLLHRRVRHALIITDGLVGFVPRDHCRRLRKLRAAVVLTAGGDRHFADILGARVFFLPEIV